MQSFNYAPLPGEVIFGVGVLQSIREQLQRRGFSRALVLSTPEQVADAQRLARMLEGIAVGIHAKAVMHVPVAVAREAIQEANRLRVDCLVCIGGGSTIGLGKAIALESSIPIVAIPTTYAGSEMTAIYGMTEGAVKKTGRDLRVVPRLVFYDPTLTFGLPKQLTITSGINAIAHAVEGLYAIDRNPISDLMAEEGIRAIASALPILHESMSDEVARTHALYGAWLCGAVLGTTSPALHHKLCHTLGGAFNLPHAETHTVVLPHAMAYNRAAAPDAAMRVSRALGNVDCAQGLYDLAKRCGAPIALKDLGMPFEGIERAARLALANPYPNPEPVMYDGVLELLTNAWHGNPPLAGK